MRSSKKGITVSSSRKIVRPFVSFLSRFAGFVLALSAGAAAGAPSSVAFWYAERPPLAELSQFDWVVL